MTLALLGFAILIGLSVLGVPVAFSMLSVGFAGFWLLRDFNSAAHMVGQIGYETAQNYGLSVLPMFVLMGNLVNHARLSHDLYAAANAFVGHRRGGLAMATILACGGFAAVSGSSIATAATMGKVSIPAMRQFGYSDRLAAGSVAAGGTLGILIPPSVVMVLYGIMTSTDIGKLFVAGILPGILGIAMYMLAVQYFVWREPKSAPAGEKSTDAQRRQALARVGPIALLFALVIGGLYFNVFTPTEGAGMGAFGALLIALWRRSLSPEGFGRVVTETVRTSAVMFTILIGGIVFSNFVNLAGLPMALTAWIGSLQVPPLVIVFAMVGVFFLLGCVLESISMILLIVPIFFPIVQHLGLDPVWFGIIVVVATEISLITPPVGLNVFVISGMFKEIGTANVFRGVMPFVGADLVRITLLILFPVISLILPSFMG